MLEKSFLKRILLLLISFAVVTAGFYWWKNSSMILPVEEVVTPFVYSTSDLPVQLSQETEKFPYTVGHFVEMFEECGKEKSAEYLESLVGFFAEENIIRYKFKYLDESQNPDSLVVSVLPNRVGYDSLDSFTADFELCFAGGDYHPWMLTEDWLLFVSSCGSGFSDESEKPGGCQKISEVVLPTIAFK